MGIPVSTEKRMLAEAEFEVVQRTHYPVVCQLSRDELVEAVRRIRAYRDKARDVSRQQRREMRGKADPRGARPAADNTGTSIKTQILSGALKRARREIQRREEAKRRESRADAPTNNPATASQ